ncbi:hypothetical protein [Gulosibacter chungangensis]|uniref:Uncharacterized protein n=1 Tax=Gulosibacter chungangensis TaxID=979746 RepID=A0A7J5BC24_9MICO|nr:hypothetical protein [Gulosibacter chungangensis]KAB1643371.1 hypothetical protein F8O05_05590 [Gulosibacter chungangensis]
MREFHRPRIRRSTILLLVSVLLLAHPNAKHTVQTKLQRYPAAEYQKPFAEVIATLRSRRIQVVESRKHKQT